MDGDYPMSVLTPDIYEEQMARFQAETVRDGRFNRVERLACLNDSNPEHDGYCPIYLMHTGWAARVLASSRPRFHVDIGGLSYFAAIASAIVPFRYYDFRYIQIPLPGVTVGQADLTKLAFKDDEIKSLSCMHVMEHVGLGRYGDPLDVQGDLKAASELGRVVATGGQLLMVLPVGQPKVVFNAHRIYSYEQVLEMFPAFRVKEFTLVSPPHYIPNADPDRVRHLAEGAGCFWLIKE